MNKKFKICQIGMKRVPSREGGIEVVVEELSKRMVSNGHEVTCLNRGGNHVSGKLYNAERVRNYRGIKLVTVPTINRRGLAAMTSSVFGAIYATFSRCDVVHFHAEGPCAMLWFPKIFGKRCIATIHGLDHQRAKWGKFASWYIMLGEKTAVRYADEIIVLSNSVKQYFKDVYGKDTILIPNGVNSPKLRPANKIINKFNLRKDDYVLYLGRIVPEKGLRYLIRAFKNVKTTKKLVIAGGSSDTNLFMSELLEMSKNDDRIIFTGFVQGEILEELYSNSYIYTLPSDLEGMPLSLLEAMSYGSCCLVSDIEECTEVIEDKAIIFKKGNVQHLTEQLQRLCDNEVLVKKYRMESKDFICNKYNWDDVTKRTLELY